MIAAEAIAGLFAMAAEVEVDRVWTDVLNPRPRVWASVQQVLRTRCPDLYERHRRVLFDRSFRDEYKRQLDRRIRTAADHVGLANKLG